MYGELKCKEKRLPVTLGFGRKREQPAVSISRDNELPIPEFY
jgi:hypothetical protein